jgi:inner membrane protein
MTQVSRLFDSVIVRWIGTALLVLLLQIPIGLIASTIDERRTTRAGAFEEVTRTWGGSQELLGPILTVPYLERWVDADHTTRTRTVKRHFLPKKLSVKGRADAEVRRRGIFDVPLYVAQLQIEGSFAIPGADQFDALPEDILWERANLSFGISDPKAIRACSHLTVAGRQLAFEPGGDQLVSGGLHVALAATGKPGTLVPFAFELSLGGSGRLAVVPAGDETQVALASAWPDPSFDGAWLPVERSVTPAGFQATWRVLHLARNFPSSWVGGQVDRARLSASAFGVSLLAPVDTYRTNERAVKYQLLFLGLTFLGFALFELLSRLKVHPIQYLLVGLALCLFYLLLLSLSEHIGFARAYAAAAAAIVALVTLYVRSVLSKGARALAAGGLLAGLYAFLFVLLQIQDYALLVGSVGLFCALAAVMWFTRKIDWYQVRAAE